MPVVTVVVDT